MHTPIEPSRGSRTTHRSAARWRQIARIALLPGAVLLCHPALAEETAAPAPGFPPDDTRVDAIGSISVGHPHDGALFNGVRMPDGRHWIVALPSYAYGTAETVHALAKAITQVDQLFPGSPKVIIGSLSREQGGPFKPHKSHQSGRDADVGFYYNPGFKVAEPGTQENLDLARTWALVRAFITTTDVEMILIDRSVQRLLEDYALRIGEDKAWVTDLFHGNGSPYSSLIKHVPGHRAHMHVRFVSPVARKRGVSIYPTLVEQGHIKLQSTSKKHTVDSGETLLSIAAKYQTSVERLRDDNKLNGDLIRSGQVLTVVRPVHLRGAFERVLVPKRRLPPAPVEQAQETRTASVD